MTLCKIGLARSSTAGKPSGNNASLAVRPDDSERVMVEYRFYYLDDSRNVLGPAQIEDLDGDATATEMVRSLLHDQTIEVWEGSRRVAVLPPLKPP